MHSLSQERLGKFFRILSLAEEDALLTVRECAQKPLVTVVTAAPRCSKAGNDAQLWYSEPITGTVRNKLNHYCLDIDDSRIVVRRYEAGRSSQHWSISDDRIQLRGKPEIGIEAGLDESRLALAANWSDKATQKWRFIHGPAQYFLIRTNDPEQVLDVDRCDERPGTHVLLWQDKGVLADNQLWFEDENGIVRAKVTGFALDATGKYVVLMPYNPGVELQQWVLGSGCLRCLSRPSLILCAHRWLTKLYLVPRQNQGGAVRPQTWIFDYIDTELLETHNGLGKHFTISNVQTGQVMEVSQQSPRPGTKCVMTSAAAYDSCDPYGSSDQQLFYLDPITGTIRTAINDYSMDIQDGRLVVNPYDAFSKQQKWQVLGRKIQNDCQKNMVLSLDEGGENSGSQILSAVYKGKPSQHWEVANVPARCFYIVSKLNGRVLDVWKQQKNAGTKVVLWDKKATVDTNQLWYEDEIGLIRSRLTGFVMDASGKTLLMKPYNPSNIHQHWVIVGERIRNRMDEKQTLTVSTPVHYKGVSLQANVYHGQEHQKWAISYLN